VHQSSRLKTKPLGLFVAYVVYSSNFKMEAASSSETSANLYQTARNRFADLTLHYFVYCRLCRGTRLGRMSDCLFTFKVSCSGDL
jgi:hypothetical protein